MRYIRSSILLSITSLFSFHTFANNTGTDLNLSMHAIAGSMGGAAYTKPQEASASVFGNPATLSQFKGTNFNLGAGLLKIEEVKNIQTTTLTNMGPANGTYSNSSISSADNYVLPTMAVVFQLSDNAYLGAGFEVDAGIGADYRNDPVYLLGGAGNMLLGGQQDNTKDTNLVLPLNIELISFNGNVAGSYQITPELSLGASITLGFGLAQFGTTGDTDGFDELGAALAGGDPDLAPVNDFGGTTSSVHDIALAGSIGATYQLPSGISYSATYKSSLKYQFDEIVYANTFAKVSGAFSESYTGYQSLSVEQPSEYILGIAFDGYFADGLLIEADVIQKNWSSSGTYKDLYDDQNLYTFGVQFENVLPNLDLRFGYSYAENPLLENAGYEIGGLNGVGSLPLGNNQTNPAFTALALDIVKIAQLSLVPVIWQNTYTAGFGYQLTENTTVNFFAAVSTAEEDSRRLNNVDAILSSLGITAETTHSIDLDSEVSYGLSITVAMP